LTGTSKNTVTKLLVEAGNAWSAYQDKTLRNLKCAKVQCNEIWSFVGCKEKNITADNHEKGWGDCWTWTALDSDTKLIICWFVGTRDAGAAYHFIHDLQERLATRVQLTTDGHKAYLSAVESAFGSEIDYAMLIKIYGKGNENPERTYSLAVCMGARKAVISGRPGFKHISTSHTERQNLSMQMGMRRFNVIDKPLFKEGGEP
jgi:IS1 family transposase